MNVKRISFSLLIVLILAVGSIFAHDKGDLMFNFEPSLGISVPDIGIRLGGTKYIDTIEGDDIDLDEAFFGGHFGLCGTVHYYFFDMFGINLGLGVNAFIHDVTFRDNNDLLGDNLTYSFTGVYITVPLGFRFSVGAFVCGAGISANFPISADAETTSIIVEKNRNKVSKKKDTGFYLDPYMGWYTDIGFDLSGRKGRGGGFGVQFRIFGPFANQIGNTTKKDENGDRWTYDPFTHLTYTFIFQSAIQLARLPIGGK